MSVAELYWIASRTPGGMLAVAPHPRGREWLEDEVQSWKEAGINSVVCLLQDQEIFNLGLSLEADICSRCAMEFLRFPIPDRDVPSNRYKAEELIDQIARRLDQGDNVVVHCRAGIGRTGLIAACVLIRRGASAEDALQMVSRARRFEVPDTDAQRDWIRNFS